jgi:hypothetical protein
MGSELSIQSCVTDVQSCALSNGSVRPRKSEQDILVVQLQQPFGMTLSIEDVEGSDMKTVSECDTNGNAAAAGVMDGMILLQINGVDMRPIDLDTLSNFISSLPPDKVITLTFLSCDQKNSCVVMKDKDSVHPTNKTAKNQNSDVVENKEKDPAMTAIATSTAAANRKSVEELITPEPQSSPDTTLVKNKKPPSGCEVQQSQSVVALAQFRGAKDKSVSEEVASAQEQTPEEDDGGSLEQRTSQDVSVVVSARQICVVGEKEDSMETHVDQQVGEEVKEERLGNKVTSTQEEELTAAVAKTMRLNAEQKVEIAKLKAEQEEVHQLKAHLQAEQLNIMEAKLKVDSEMAAAAMAKRKAEEDAAHLTASLIADKVLLESRIAELQDEGSIVKGIAASSSEGNLKISKSTSSTEELPHQSVPLSLADEISSSTSNTFSADEKQLISECMLLLQGGIEVKKHNRLVAPSAKWLHIDSQFEKLYWRNEVDNGGSKKSKSQRNIFGKSDSEREVCLSEIIEVISY